MVFNITLGVVINIMSSMERITCKICGGYLNCGKEYCSRACRHKAMIKGKMIQCATCGKERWAYPKDLKRSGSLYCSKECHFKGQFTSKVIQCLACGKEVKKFQSALNRGAKYCSLECQMALKRSPDFDPKGRTGGKAKKWQISIKTRDKMCVFCGKKDSLRAHHIFSWRDYVELRFDVNNGETLCADCHKFVHSKGRQSNLFLRTNLYNLTN